MNRFVLQIIWFPWTLWCGLTFVFALTISFPLLLAGVMSRNERWLHRLHYIPPAIARTLLFLWGIRIELHEERDQHHSGPYVYISNHTSYLDALVAGGLIRDYIKFLGKGEILYWPVLGYLLKNLYVPVWRNDQEHRTWSMEQMKQKINDGASFFICPEGTCNTTPQLLKHFHSGAFRLAVDCRIPLVIMTIVGSSRLFPRKGLMIRPGKVIVYRHKAIIPGPVGEAEVERLKNLAISLITSDLLKHYPDGKNPL